MVICMRVVVCVCVCDLSYVLFVGLAHVGQCLGVCG